MVHVIRLASFLWLRFQSVCPLMPSLSTYYLSGVSLTLYVGVSPLGHSSTCAATAHHNVRILSSTFTLFPSLSWNSLCLLVLWKKKKTASKDLHDPDNHNGVITHLEPDILECEVKWAWGSITTNKASGVHGIPLEFFKSWKMMLWKCCTQYASKFGKLSGHRTGKDQFSFQSQRKAMPKNAQTTAQLHSSHTLVK